MGIGSGFSKHSQAEQAITEAYQQALLDAQLETPDWILLFITPHYIPHAQALHQTLVEISDCSNIVGCSAHGVLCHGIEVFEDRGLVLLVGSDRELRLRAHVHHQELEHGTSLQQQVKERLESYDSDTLAILFPDADQLHPYNLCNTLNYLKNAPAVFAAASSKTPIGHPGIQIGPEGVVQHGVAVACIESQKSKFQYAVTHSSEALADPMFITESQNNVMQSVDQYPALEAFATMATHVGLDNIEDAMDRISVAFPHDPEAPRFEGESCFIRKIAGIDVASRGLEIGEVFGEGDIVSFFYCDAATAEHDLYGMLERLKSRSPETPKMGLYLNDQERGCFTARRPNLDVDAISEVLGDFPMIGLFSSYEMAPTPKGIQLHSNSAILLLFY